MGRKIGKLNLNFLAWLEDGIYGDYQGKLQSRPSSSVYYPAGMASQVKLNNMAQRGIQGKGSRPNKWVDKAAKPNGLYLLAL